MPVRKILISSFMAVFFALGITHAINADADALDTSDCSKQNGVNIPLSDQCMKLAAAVNTAAPSFGSNDESLTYVWDESKKTSLLQSDITFPKEISIEKILTDYLYNEKMLKSINHEEACFFSVGASFDLKSSLEGKLDTGRTFKSVTSSQKCASCGGILGKIGCSSGGTVMDCKITKNMPDSEIGVRCTLDKKYAVKPITDVTNIVSCKKDSATGQSQCKFTNKTTLSSGVGFKSASKLSVAGASETAYLINGLSSAAYSKGVFDKKKYKSSEYFKRSVDKLYPQGVAKEGSFSLKYE